MGYLTRVLRSRRPLAISLIALLLLGGCTSRESKAHPNDLRGLVGAKPPKGSPKFQPLSAEERKGLTTDTIDDYRIGVGDLLNIQSSASFLKGFGETTKGDIAGTKVKSDGKIYLPGFPEPIQAAGRTVIDLQTDVQARLLDVISKIEREPKNPYVSIDVLQYRSQKSYVLGEVTSPGVFSVDGEMTILEAVAKAGGVTKQADVEQAFVVRNKKVLPISVADLIRRGDMSQNLVLQHRDLVFVPTVKVERVMVLGEVLTPGVFPFEGYDGDRHMTLVEAVARAGGLKAESADVNQIRVFRGGWCNPECFTISACELYTHGESIELFPGDRVLVAPMAEASYSRALALATPFLTTPLAIATTLLAIDATRK